MAGSRKKRDPYPRPYLVDFQNFGTSIMARSYFEAAQAGLQEYNDSYALAWKPVFQISNKGRWIQSVHRSRSAAYDVRQPGLLSMMTIIVSRL